MYNMGKSIENGIYNHPLFQIIRKGIIVLYSPLQSFQDQFPFHLFWCENIIISPISEIKL